MPKQLNLFIIVCFIALQSTAQKINTDSLWQLVTTTKNDSFKFNLFQKIDDATENSLDETYAYCKKLVEHGEKNKDKSFIVFGYRLYASFYNRIGNYIKGQEALVKATTIAEDMPDNGNYLSLIYNSKGTRENDFNKKIEFLKKGISLCKDEFFKRVLFYNVSTGYLANNQVDSALFYAQKSQEIVIKYHDTSSSYNPNIFGRIYLKLKQPEIAFAYFKRALQIAETTKLLSNYTVAYNGLIAYFTEFHNMDSVLVYQKKKFAFNTPDAYASKVAASNFVYNYYLQNGNKDSVIKYLLFNKQGNDSLNSLKKIQDLKQAQINEELRQKDFAFAQQASTESRNRNIQLAITAIAILSVIILFLLLSRSILVSHKVVEFLSVLVLLVVFEFINLLIHPFLESITHHSPVLMLLGLVAIASLIIPLHHRLEHWTTKKLVEKNKAIRLANAKKTIKEIESSN